MHRRFRIAVVSALTIAAGVAIALAAQPDSVKEPNAQPPQGDIGSVLVGGIKATPGCLGVELCQWQNGKQSIVAWFKDKPSVVAWYKSRIHVSLMEAMGATPGVPLEHVADDAGPIMVIATITESEENLVPGFPLPISQVSIELYEVLPGGAMLNGRLAPEGVEIPHLKDFTEYEDGGR